MAKGSTSKRPRKDSAKSLKRQVEKALGGGGKGDIWIRESDGAVCKSVMMMMTNDELLRAWAVKAWEKEVTRNMPVAKAARQLRADGRESRKAWASARRSMAAQQASNQRKLHQRQADIEREFRERERNRDREFEERRWDVLVGKR